MFEEEIGKIKSLLPGALRGALAAEKATEFESLWDAGVRLLADRSSDKRAFFRDTLLFTIKLNRRFTVGAATGNRIRRIILDTFMERSLDENSQQNSYSEQVSSLSQNAAEEHTAKHIVFNALLSELEKQFDTRFNISGTLKQELVGSIRQMPISSRSKMVMERWVTTNPFMGSFDRISENDMRLVIDQVYTMLCDQWGPSDADEHFSQSITLVETIPESRQFSLKKIL